MLDRASGLPGPSGLFVPRGPSATGDDAEDRMFDEKDGNSNSIIGFCSWCGQTFYTVKEMEAHSSDTLAQCEVYRRHRVE